MKYSVVIRTLGTAGEYYQRTLDSLKSQTIQPSAVLIYISEGYAIPKETIGIERYIYVQKGMVAQRALSYEEVQTEYCLFLDDDVFLPPDAVEKMYDELLQHNAQVISPCTFDNHKASFKSKLIRTLTGKEICRMGDKKWAFKVSRTAGFSYNNNPILPVYESQSNAGPCFFCRKDDFLKIAFHEELWLDDAPYAFPEDQVMFYKMYKKGLKVLTSFDAGVVHLDAGSTIKSSSDRVAKIIFSEYRNKLIFWHRFIFLPESSAILKIWSIFCLSYVYGLQIVKSILKILIGKSIEAKAFWRGCVSGITYITSREYHSLPRI